MKSQISFIVYVLITVTGLAGCSVFSPPRVADSYFLLENPPCSQEKKPTRNAKAIVLKHTQAGARVEGKRIVFARSAQERGFYQFAFWAAAPYDAIHEILRRQLECGVETVLTDGLSGDQSSDFTLETELLEFVHDISSQPGTVRVELRATLINAQGQASKRLFSKIMDATSFDARGAVTAFNEAVKQITNDLILWLHSEQRHM